MQTSPDPVSSRLAQWRSARLAWLLVGLVLVAIGILGIFIPLLPTTDFMLLALPCFARSSPKLETWLLSHRRFGASLRAWRRNRAVPKRAKIAACAGMMLGYVLFAARVSPGPLPALAVAAFLVFWAIWIVRRPGLRGDE